MLNFALLLTLADIIARRAYHLLFEAEFGVCFLADLEVHALSDGSRSTVAASLTVHQVLAHICINVDRFQVERSSALKVNVLTQQQLLGRTSFYAKSFLQSSLCRTKD